MKNTQKGKFNANPKDIQLEKPSAENIIIFGLKLLFKNVKFISLIVQIAIISKFDSLKFTNFFL